MSAKSGEGYCSRVCRMGESSCPTGYTCDAGLPKTMLTAPLGLQGNCLRDCTTDADCTTLASYCEEMGGTGRKTCQPGVR